MAEEELLAESFRAAEIKRLAASHALQPSESPSPVSLLHQPTAPGLHLKPESEVPNTCDVKSDLMTRLVSDSNFNFYQKPFMEEFTKLFLDITTICIMKS